MRIFALAVLAAACGGSSNTVGSQGNCTASLSGAVTASGVTCTAVAGTDTNGSGTGAIGITFVSTGGPSATVAVKTTGTPTTKTYANTDSDANGACQVTQSNNQFWVAAAGTPTSNQGTYSVSITGLGNEVTNPDGGPGNVFLSVHGTANCTMPAIAGTGATGTVTLTATF